MAVAAHDPMYRRLLSLVLPRGQEHVLRFWPELSAREKEALESDLSALPWELIDQLIQTHVVKKPVVAVPIHLAPAPVMPVLPGSELTELYSQARAEGERWLRAGRVAAFTVAGGQGTRLGIDGPKGAVVVTPDGSRTLFQLFAEMVVAARRKYGAAIPWYIMTSPANHQQTRQFFVEHHWFGLPESDVRLFPQGMLPALDFTGRLMMEDRHRLALSPDGHGGSLKALAGSGSLDDMRRRGVSTISYFQVDNPLVKPFDRLFIGLHALTGSEMSTKVLPKADDLERVGNLCMQDGKVMVIEYSDFPAESAHAKNSDGSRKFNAGNAAIHLFQVDFVERITAHALPFRRAEKAIPCIDERGRPTKPDNPNGVKLETFVFDVMPLAKNPLLLEIDRAEEFSPVKNATGVDSLESSRRDQNRRACRWLAAAGVIVPRRGDGEPAVTVTLAPTFALDPEDVVAKRESISNLTAGEAVLLIPDGSAAR